MLFWITSSPAVTSSCLLLQPGSISLSLSTSTALSSICSLLSRYGSRRLSDDHCYGCHWKWHGLGQRERTDVGEIPAVGAPLIPFLSLLWVLREVSEVWETGRNLKSYISPGICSMTVRCRRVSVRTRLVCSSGSLSYSPCRSLSAHYCISGLYTLDIDTVRGVPPDEHRTWEPGAPIQLSRFQLAVTAGVAVSSCTSRRPPEYSILRILLCRGVL